MVMFRKFEIKCIELKIVCLFKVKYVISGRCDSFIFCKCHFSCDSYSFCKWSFSLRLRLYDSISFCSFGFYLRIASIFVWYDFSLV